MTTTLKGLGMVVLRSADGCKDCHAEIQENGSANCRLHILATHSLRGPNWSLFFVSRIATPSACYRGPKRQKCPKWLGEGAKGALDPGSKGLPRVCCTTQTLFCTGATLFCTSGTQRKRDDNKNKICVFRGRMGRGAERRIVQNAIFHGKRHDKKHFESENFVVEEFCCHGAGS